MRPSLGLPVGGEHHCLGVMSLNLLLERVQR
jgi:hypothetical protein